MRGAISISMVRFRGLVRGPSSSKYYSFNALRSYCESPTYLSQPKPPGPLSQYRNLLEQGKLQYDANQERVASELDKLFGRLEQYEKEMEEYHENLAKWEEKRESERRKLLVGEAELKQNQDVWSSVSKRRAKLVERLMKKAGSLEPGVGKWVSYLNREKKLDSLVGPRPTAPAAPKGLSIDYSRYNVSTASCLYELGKTMLMDMFYGATEGIVKHRRRYHFHEAMLKINEEMHKIWKNQVEEKPLQSSISNWIMNLPLDTKIKEWLAAEEKYKQEVQMKNILPAVADKLLIDWKFDKKGASILCFDEIQTVDVFAIVALSGIVSRLLSTGTVLVATSNRAPNDLNQDGMQREIFEKFLAKLDKHCESVLIGSEIDYRRLIAERSINQVHYFSPLDSIAIENFEKMWHDVTEQVGGQITSSVLPVMFGRTLEVPESCNGVARFTFEYLCGRPVGAADYIAAAENYHTVFISGIPMMSMRIRDKARRFITLIDELYNHHCRLFCSAASSIDELFQGTEEETEGSKLRRDVLVKGNVGSGGAPTGIKSMLSGQEEMFAFRRAVSRLIEMQTPLYLEGVRLLHPYFRRQCQEFHSLQSQSSF
ncbi:hypothetical protein FEM48_Zijuj06G0144000 [Ziziphus jujuba var. spinosa]|uniref:AFG1-like ATPase n=1 Tax=Ziziphus jujuba var. spinosa TaxID=714518 RepID=A0A978V9T2_ZIZJJ|nr:hypothetical protein FEM48_Zijuj06G0144000 [Ziziphus jujuba var. spinosa]